MSATIVLGGAGFIGSHIVEALVNQGIKAIVFDNLKDGPGHGFQKIMKLMPNPLLEIHNSGVGDSSSTIANMLNNVSCVISAMGWTRHKLGIENPVRDLEDNLLSHLQLLQILRGAPSTHLIYLGSRGQYGLVEGKIGEQSPQLPDDPQGVHKAAAERHIHNYCKMFGMNGISLRLSNTIGVGSPTKGEDLGLFGELTKNLMLAKQCEIFGTKRKRPICDAIDVADVVVRLVKKPLQGFHAFNMKHHDVSVLTLAHMIKEKLGTGEIVVREMPDKLKVLERFDATIDSLKLEEFLGQIDLKPINKSVSDSVSFMMEHKNDLAV